MDFSICCSCKQLNATIRKGIWSSCSFFCYHCYKCNFLPGVEIYNETLIDKGTIVIKAVNQYEVVVGNPAKAKGDVRSIID